MKKLIAAAVFTFGVIVGVEAAPTDAVTQADLQAIISRLNKLEAENKAQAQRISELEGKNRELMAQQGATVKALQAAETKAVVAAKADDGKIKADKGTEVSDTGKIYTTSNGKKYYLADASAKIFEPLSESGFQITPYGYLVFEGVYSTRPLDLDWSADFVTPGNRGSYSTLSMQDSILGIQFMTPEAHAGWKFSGKAEFDLAGDHQNDYAFHWRHLYVDAAHETGWSILFGQTWHLWKMVSPSEIDGAWMENAGHPYRRSPQLRVTKRWDWTDSSFEARVGIVKGGPGMGKDRDKNGYQDNSQTAWCLFEGAALYDHVAPWQEDNRRWLIGLGGMYGKDKSNRYSAAYGFSDYQGDEYDSMMGMIAAKVPVWKFTLTGQFYGGQNLGGVQAGCGQTVIYHPSIYDSAFVKGNGVRTIGGFVDLGYQINDKWSAAVGYGCDDPVDGDVEGGASNVGNNGILFNDRIYIAAFYQVTGNFKLGLEYARLLTTYSQTDVISPWGGNYSGDYDADRVQFSAFFDF